MNRLRKFSTKVFQKDSPKPAEVYAGTKPIYRGKTPLTVSDIHSHSPVESQTLDDLWDELGVRNRPAHPVPDSKAHRLVDILDRFPEPPPFQPVVSNAHPGGQRFYFPMEDLLPPPPERVLEMVKDRERTRTHEARFEQQRTMQARVNSYDQSPPRRPLYANSGANMSTRSLGANARLKVVAPSAQQANVHHSQRAYPEGQRGKLHTMPEGERKRLRSVPTQLSPAQLGVANEELYKAYPSTLHPR